MESQILVTQAQITDAISKIGTNFKKDGPERKTLDYIKRRIENLTSYWSEYQKNHDILCDNLDHSHSYFTTDQFEQTRQSYEAVRSLIERYRVETGKSSPLPSIGKPEQLLPNPGVSRPSTPNNQGTTPTDFGSVKQMSFATTSRGTSSKVDEMLRKQSSNFRAFSRTVSAINVQAISEKWALEDALNTLQTRWNVIDKLHWDIDSELCGENQSYEDSYSKQEAIYNSVKSTINSKIWSTSHREKSTPKVELPIFNGSFQNFVSFKDLFYETIHYNPSLSPAQKMQFLKSKVKGEAERLIQHLKISSENYQTCWDILNHRYDNTRRIFCSYAGRILNLPTVQQKSLTHIKRMHDTTKECLHAIENLGIDISNWDPLLVYILSLKLDPETHDDFIESMKSPKEVYKLSEFLDYLDAKFTSLESSRKKPEPSSSTSYQQRQNIVKEPYYYGKKQPNSKPNAYLNQTQLAENKSYYSNSNYNFNRKCTVCNTGSHKIFHCKTFIGMPVDAKLKLITKLKLCKNCLYNHNDKDCISNSRCRECNEQHNTLLHSSYSAIINSNTGQALGQSISGPNLSLGENRERASHVSQDVTGAVILATALVNVRALDGTYQTLRALIDQGSQISVITERAAQLLNLPRKRNKGVVSGIGAKESSCKGALLLNCKALHTSYEFQSEVVIMQTLIKNLPNYSFNKPSWEFLSNICLADPDFNISRPVDLLFGADMYSSIILEGIVNAGPAQPIAQQTRLGWILCGNVQTYYQCNVILNTDDLRKFWEIEDIHEQSNLSSEEQQCIDFYLATTERLSDGRYKVRMPFKPNHEEKLGLSKPLALAQFRSLEKKFDKNEQFASDYKDFMTQYYQLGHMTLSSGISTQQEYVVPHHAVVRKDAITTKMRVVFNASAKTSSGYSLNDIMCKGPNLQLDIAKLILTWRQYKYAFISDIEMMFRQIYIHSDDQKYQKVLWRTSVNQPIKTYQLTTVTYGTTAAPFLALMTLRKVASDEKHRYPEAAKAVEECFYMDDYCGGHYTIEKAKQLKSDLIQLLKSGGFNLRKWTSNTSELLSDLSKDQCNPQTYEFKGIESTKTLGLGWNPHNDVFVFKSKIEISDQLPTKRSILSDISKLFDPLGWLAPITTSMKILFQGVWLSQLSWDDHLPHDINRKWISLRNELQDINCFEINRWLGIECEQDTIELHGFCDGSQKCYAAVVYIKINQTNGSKISLVAAKTRLAPCGKTISTPRLELSGAVLLSKLMLTIQQCFSNHIIKVYGWIDSTAVLGWIQGDPSRWQTFVANRVRTITAIMPADCWQYVNTNENPADCASRGLSVSQLKNHALWWNGPAWLSSFMENKIKIPKFTTDLEARPKIINVVTKQSNKLQEIINYLLQKYSSLIRIVRILAWILRLSTKKDERQSYLTLKELTRAKHIIIKHIQHIEFNTDIACLLKGNKLPTSSKITNLNPFVDSEGLLRVGGRLRNAHHITSDMKYPIIIPYEGQLTALLITQAHQLTFHGGARVTLANLRQKYWILSGNRSVKKHLRGCVTCRKYDQKKQTQLMGDLPVARVNPAHPFYHTGVDYTGFVDVKTNKGRGVVTSKGYIAIFICLVTKAIHIEIVSDCTSAAFISALRRMSARRGTPYHLYSDNGTNFVGANKVLQQSYLDMKSVLDDHFFIEITNMNIQWHFNAPQFPSGGGYWERAVRSLKHHMKRVIGEQKLTFEEWTTMLAQIEACLNSRPLCPLSEDPEDLDFLTPSHFLTGRSGLTVIDTEHDARTRWHLISKIKQDIWNRWKGEYLTQLSARTKWLDKKSNIQIGDLVVIHEDNIPPGKWAMGRVTQIHPGNDGLVRVVTLKTKNGFIKRPVIKLSILPISDCNKDLSPGDDQMNNSQNSSQPCVHRYTKKRDFKTSFISLAISFILFFNIISTISCSFSITTLPQNQSLYFEPISKMQLIRDKWILVTYFNMEPYWEGIKAFNKISKHLDNTCSQINVQTYCNITLLQLRHDYNEFKYYNELLQDQHFSAHGRQRRRRRGLINAVGSIANDLFGVLDQRFAEKYELDISQLRNNAEYMIHLWKNQTSIVEAQYNLLQRTEATIAKQHKIINQHINNLEQTSNIVQQEIKNLTFIQDFTLGTITASSMLQNLKTIQTNLLNTLTDIYQNQFSIHLLRPEQLERELQVISNQLSRDLTLPINNFQNVRDIYKFLKVKARMSEAFFIFETTFPLISRDVYHLYKIIPIPYQLEQSMLQVIPIAECVGINLNRDSYLSISGNEIEKCQHNYGTYLCDLPRPIMHLKKDERFCLLERNQCKLTKSTCKNSWLELNDPSLYFYFCCDDYQLRFICDDQIEKRSLNQAGIINLGTTCVAKGDDFSLYPQKRSSNILDISPNIIRPKVIPLDQIFNLSLPILESENNVTDFSDNISLKNLHEQIMTMKEKANQLPDVLSTHDIHHYSISYTLLVVVIIAAVLFLWRWKRRRVVESQRQEAPSPNNPYQCSVVQLKADAQPSVIHPNQVFFTKSSAKLFRDSCNSPMPIKHVFETEETQM